MLLVLIHASLAHFWNFLSNLPQLLDCIEIDFEKFFRNKVWRKEKESEF